MGTIALTAQSFAAMMREPGVTIVEFWGPKCAPCVAYRPIFERAAQEHSGARFATVDTQAELTLAAELGVSGVPTIRAYRDGIEVMNVAGTLTSEQLGGVIDAVNALDMDDLVERAVTRQPLPTIVPPPPR